MSYPSENSNSLNLIHYGLSMDRRTIQLTPLHIPEGGNLRNLSLKLPQSVFSESTLSVHSMNFGDLDGFVIDLIDSDYLFITVKINTSCFFVENENMLLIENFKEWVKISAPYSFELRSEPLVLRLLDSMNLVVSLKDGGLLHFKRKTILGDSDIYGFQQQQPISLNLIEGLLPFMNSTKTSDSICPQSVIDLVAIDINSFITISLDQSLCYWDISRHTIISRQTLLSKSYERSLNLLSKKYLVREEIDGRIYVFSMMSSSAQMWAEILLVPNLRCFEVLQEHGLIEHDCSFPLIVRNNMSTSESRQDGHIQVQDFEVTHIDKSTLQASFLLRLKGHGYLIDQKINLTQRGGVALIRKGWEPEPALLVPKCSSNSEIEAKKLIESGRYDDTILCAALQSLSRKFAIANSPADEPQIDDSIFHALKIVAMRNKTSFSLLLSQFFLICEELKKQSQEPLAIFAWNNVTLVSQVHGVGLYTSADFDERQISNTPIARTLSKVRARISDNTLLEIRSRITLSFQVDSEFLSSLADKFMVDKFTEQEIYLMVHDILSDATVGVYLTQIINGPSSKVTPHTSSLELSKKLSINHFDKALAKSAFRVIIQDHEIILEQVAALLLLFDANEVVVRYVRDINLVLKKYSLFKLTLSSHVSYHNRVYSTFVRGAPREDLALWKIPFQNYAETSRCIELGKFDHAFELLSSCSDALSLAILVSKAFITLFNCEDFDYIEDSLRDLLDLNDDVHIILKAFLDFYNGRVSSFLDVVLDIKKFWEASSCLRVLAVKSLEKPPKFKNWITSLVFTSPDDKMLIPNYFHELAIFVHELASESKACFDDVIQASVVLEKQAIATLNEVGQNADKYQDLLEAFHRRLFDRSLKIEHYVEASKSLMQLDMLIGKEEFKSLVTRFLKKLISNNKIHILFEPSLRTKFLLHHHLVDRVLLEISNEDLLLSKALRCYETLFSWRSLTCTLDGPPFMLADRRGAAEALYIFITRFRIESEGLILDSSGLEDFRQYKLKILELYMIILNCLKSYSREEDRWLMKKNGNGLSVLYIEELQLEYIEWLEQLKVEVH